MAIRSATQFLFLPYRLKNPNFRLTPLRLLTTASSAVEIYWNLLQKHGPESNLEKALGKNRAKLDFSCVEEIIKRCSVDRSVLGLRFFIWAGLQSDYRHSKFTYSRACELFEIERRRQTLIDVLEAYRVEGCSVSIKMFNVILNLCEVAKLDDEALGVLRKMTEFNCRPDTTSYNIVIRLLNEKGDVDVAVRLMEEMALINLYPNMITYVMMIKGLCSVGRLEEACRLFKVMRGHGCSPNFVTYSALLDGLCKSGCVERALELLGEMEKESDDCKPNVVTYTSLIQGFCEMGQSMEALSILDRMGAHGCLPNRVTVSTLFKGLCGEGHIEEARKLIDKLVMDGSVSKGECYSSLVVSLLRIDNLEEAVKLFRRMLASGIKPDGLACSSMLRALCSRGQAIDGFRLYNEIDKMEYLSSIDSDAYSILLVKLCEQSLSVEAAKIARAMVEQGVRLKSSYFDEIVENLKRFGEKELVLYLNKIGQ